MPNQYIDDNYGGYTPSDYVPSPDTSASSYVPTVIAGSDSGTQPATTQPDVGALAAQYLQNQTPAATTPTYTTGQAADPKSAAYDPNMAGTNGVQTPPEIGVFSKLLQGMGIQNKNGEIDYSDPKVMDKILKAVSIGGSILTTLQGPQNKKTASELSAQFKNPYDKFSAPAQSAADSYFGGAYQRHGQQAANTMASPIVSGQKYAAGGEVEGSDSVQDFDSRGPLSLVRGSDKGQADTVNAHLSHGEYVFDADTVASLGDGNNEAGAKILDKWREELRSHKRAAPSNQIPPKAKAPSHYLGKVK